MPPKRGKKGGKSTVQETAKLRIDEDIVVEKVLPLYLTHGTTQKDKDIVIEGISLTTPNGQRELIANATLRLIYGRHYGLIGQNGIGKSTLLHAISKYQIPGFPQNMRVVHVMQEEIPRDDLNVPVYQYVMQSDEVKNYLEAEEQRLLSLMEGDEDDGNGEYDMDQFAAYEQQLDEVYRRLEVCGARTAEARARSILTGLQFTEEMQNNTVGKLSGGWKMRVRLACALFVTPDLLLLDEPTNHLDFPAVEWLTTFLQSYEPTLLVVSHDRGFLDAIMTDCIDFRDKTLMYYRGDYSNYVRVRADAIRRHNRLCENTEKKRAALHKFIMEARQQAKDDPNLAEMAASRQRILDALPVLTPIVEDKSINFQFPDPGSLDHAIVTCKDMYFSYDPTADGSEQKPYLLNNIDAYIDLKSRIGIMGSNGAGKTTLINVLLGKYKPLKGEVRVNDQARTRVFTQHHLDQLDPNKSALQFLQDKFPKENEGRLRGFLGRFGFDKVLAEQQINRLSGGQKSRVAFAVLTYETPHLVIMDEPTNHLDIETIESLIKALNSFKGAVLIISHDRYFLESIAEEFWAVDARGTMKRFYELSEAKDYSYPPIEFKVEHSQVNTATAIKRNQERAARRAGEKVDDDDQAYENDEDVRYRELQSVLGDDDDDLDEDKLLQSLDKKANEIKNVQKKSAAPAAAAPTKKYQPPKGNDSPKYNVGKKATTQSVFSSFALDDDDDDLFDDSDEEEESEEQKPAAAAKKQPAKPAAKQAGKGKKKNKGFDSDDDDDVDIFTKFGDLAESLADEKAPPPKAKKGKKNKKASGFDDDKDDLDQAFNALSLDLGAADDEVEGPAQAKKQKKKAKKTIEPEVEPVVDDLDDAFASLADDLGGDDIPVQPKKSKKKSKKVNNDFDDNLDDAFSLLANDLGEDCDIPVEPKKSKKKAKKDVLLDDNLDDAFASLADDLGGDDIPVEPKKFKKKSKKVVEEFDDNLDDAFALLADDLGDDIPVEPKKSKKKSKKTVKSELDDDNLDDAFASLADDLGGDDIPIEPKTSKKAARKAKKVVLDDVDEEDFQLGVDLQPEPKQKVEESSEDQSDDLSKRRNKAKRRAK